MEESAGAAIDLAWIPLGAGEHLVRLCGRVYESLDAFVSRRSRCDLFHSALVITDEGVPTVVEVTPIPRSGAWRGVVAEGAVGMRPLGRLRIFRYEVRVWRGGSIPDISRAVGTVRVTTDPHLAAQVLRSLRDVPAPVWGRDELGTGDMWNSNSVVSWALTMGGVEVDALAPPPGGRAPGWVAGITVARREQRTRAAIR